MKLLYSLIICLLLYCNSQAQSPAITDINNNSLVVDSMNGKKALVMLLPLQQDTSVINQLLRFQSRHGGQIKIIGLACWGSSNSSADSIRALYADVITAGIFVTQGLQSSDSSANQRQGVLKWLSDINRNRQVSSAAVGHKYLISEGGRLFAEPGKSISLDSRLIENIIKTKVPGEHY